MNAEVLRRAARLMRERAEAATQGPWLNRRGPGEHVLVINGIVNVETPNPREDRRHIASWHPAVALAVADWMDASARDEEAGAITAGQGDGYPVTVARAFLGESA